MTTPTLASPAVTLELDGDVAVIRLDDGKANALTHEIIDSLRQAVDVARTETNAIALVGREGKLLSAGFDLTAMRSGPNQARDLMGAGAELGIALFDCPIPVVLGVTGHALAMGAILLFCADVRIGAEGDYKIGMNEVAIGMPVPRFAITLADARLDRRALNRAVNLAGVFDPTEAIAIGYLDEVVAPEAVASAAISRAHELASSLHRGAFRLTREYLRGATAQSARRDLDEDIKTFTVADV
jgi:enoyl-CoA hydratase